MVRQGGKAQGAEPRPHQYLVLRQCHRDKYRECPNLTVPKSESRTESDLSSLCRAWMGTFCAQSIHDISVFVSDFSLWGLRFTWSVCLAFSLSLKRIQNSCPGSYQIIPSTAVVTLMCIRSSKLRVVRINMFKTVTNFSRTPHKLTS